MIISSVPDSAQEVITEDKKFVATWFTYFSSVFRAITNSVSLTNVSVSADFPSTNQIQTGLSQCFALTNVTDNDPSRTNTGQHFNTGDLGIWNGTNWTIK